MPLTPFQKEVMSVLAAQRHKASHMAGGLVLNTSDDSARFSRDFDIFHDSVEELVAASERDVLALEGAGFEVHKVGRDGEWSKPVSFRKARVSRGDDREPWRGQAGSKIRTTLTAYGFRDGCRRLRPLRK